MGRVPDGVWRSALAISSSTLKPASSERAMRACVESLLDSPLSGASSATRQRCHDSTPHRACNTRQWQPGCPSSLVSGAQTVACPPPRGRALVDANPCSVRGRYTGAVQPRRAASYRQVTHRGSAGVPPEACIQSVMDSNRCAGQGCPGSGPLPGPSGALLASPDAPVQPLRRYFCCTSVGMLATCSTQEPRGVAATLHARGSALSRQAVIPARGQHKH